MAGDYTRFTHRPRKRYSGVLMQQGRVQLDADWNEQVAIGARRWRVQALDTFGRAAVSELSTPAAFLVEPLAVTPPDFQLGPGRIYVDGLVAEIFPGEAPRYLGQASLFYPQPPPLPTSGEALVYLDVWERELNSVQDPDLLEIALGGPDTTTRTQTAWQVKVTTAASDCLADLDALFPPSGGRLTTDANAPAGSDDPCVLSPAGGYRGLENRLYRVEIHHGGALGTARFKWSRDNASIVAAVSDISVSGSQTTLKVSRIGRDPVLRFRQDDWVEVTDDHRELMGEPGEMARVLDAGESTLTVVVDRALPTGGGRAFATNKGDHLARHTRLVRWDQNSNLNALDADGLMTADGAQVQLEDGVLATFGGGPMRTGDYWVFAARTADASVEKLEQARPRGIVHHYAPLAVISIANGAVHLEHDCRMLWPPGSGCCTAVVKPGEDIQAAIDALPPAGGCVCLKTGVHVIGAPIRIDRSRVLLHGESPGTIVRTNGFAPDPERSVMMLDVHAAAGRVGDIVVEGLRFELTQAFDAIAAVINLEACDRVAVRHCGVMVPADLVAQYGAIQVSDASEVTIADNRFAGMLIGVYASDCRERLEIVGNRMRGLMYRMPDTLPGTPNAEFSLGWYGIHVDAGDEAPCRIGHNLLEHFLTGVHLARGADGSSVEENHILRGMAADDSPLPDDAEKLRSYVNSRIYAIDVVASDCSVRGNRIELLSSAHGGIRTAGLHTVVEGNVVDSQSGDQTWLAPVGLCCTAEGLHKLAAHHTQLRDNLLTGAQLGVFVYGSDAVTIAGNHVDAAGRGWYGIRCDEAEAVVICDNDVGHCLIAALYLSGGNGSRVIDNRIDDAFLGVMLIGETAPELRGNQITSGRLSGVFAGFKGSVELASNRIANCGYFAGMGFGVAAGNEEWLAAEATLRLDGCEIVDPGLAPDGTETSDGAVYGVLGLVVSAQLTGNRIIHTQPQTLNSDQQQRAVLLVGPLSIRYTVGAGELELSTGSALLTDNLLQGLGRKHLVEFFRWVIFQAPGMSIDTRHEKLTFSNNICRHGPAAADEAGATIKLWGSQQVAMGNQVKGPVGVNSFHLSGRPTMLMGNTHTGAIIGAGGARPAAIADFNFQV